MNETFLVSNSFIWRLKSAMITTTTGCHQQRAGTTQQESMSRRQQNGQFEKIKTKKLAQENRDPFVILPLNVQF